MSILVLTESQKNTKEPYREVNMHDHTLTGVTGPLHSGCYTEVYSLCTAGPYLFPCGSYTSVASAQAFINLLLLFNSPLFLSLIASHLLKRRKSNVIILPLPLRFCLLFFFIFHSVQVTNNIHTLKITRSAAILSLLPLSTVAQVCAMHI